MLGQGPREELMGRPIDQRRHEPHPGPPPMHPVRGAGQWFGQAPELAHPAAGEQCDDPCSRIQVQPRAGRAPAGAHRDLVGERMPHEPHRNRVCIIKRRLERKQREHHVHGSRDLPEPVTPPGPDGGADEMNGPDPGAAQRELEREVEVRGVHADERIGRIAGEPPGQTPPDGDQLQVAADDLEQPHDRQALHRIQGLAAERRHARPRDALEARFGNAGPDRFDEPACEHVPGRLAGDDGEPQGASPSPPLLIARSRARKTSRIHENGPPPRIPSPARRADRPRRRG